MQAHGGARKMCALLKLTGEGCSPSFLLSHCRNATAPLQTGAQFWVHLVPASTLGLEALGAVSCKNLKISPNIHAEDTRLYMCVHERI